jgi:hypothetical protein
MQRRKLNIEYPVRDEENLKVAETVIAGIPALRFVAVLHLGL